MHCPWHKTQCLVCYSHSAKINDRRCEHPLSRYGKVHTIAGGIPAALIKVQSPHNWLLTIEHFQSWQSFRKSLLESFICYQWLSSIEKNLCPTFVKCFGIFEVSLFFVYFAQSFLGIKLPAVLLLSLGGWNAGLPWVHVFEVAYLWKLPPTFEIQGIALTAESSPNNSIYNFPSQARLAVLHERVGH